MIYDIRTYGAVPDGTTLNTAAIQSAIDACGAAGGGTVQISGGTYLTGTIELRTGVELHIDAAARLLGSPDCADYPEKDRRHVDRRKLPRRQSASLIFAEECERIAITGRGTIDANGDSFIERVPDGEHYWMPYRRIDAPTPPRVVFFTGCRNVLVTDVTMTNPPAGWSYWIHDCDDVHFDRVQIRARLDYPNNDGIHINSSRNVTVSNALISCGDDCIIVRANNSSLAENKVCENVAVTNCTLTSHSGGIRVGWVNDGIIRNCVFSNLVMTDTTVGISILLPYGFDGSGTRLPDSGREATHIENLSFDHIMMDRGYSYPIYIHINGDPRTQVDCIRNLHFSRIHARAHQMPHIVGRPGCPVTDLTFSDCSFTRLPAPADDHQSHGATMHNADGSYATVELQYARRIRFRDTEFTLEDENA